MCEPTFMLRREKKTKKHEESREEEVIGTKFVRNVRLRNVIRAISNMCRLRNATCLMETSLMNNNTRSGQDCSCSVPKESPVPCTAAEEANFAVVR